MKTRTKIACLVLALTLLSTLLVGCTAKTATEFSQSDGLDENGFWKGITALNYVELPSYQPITIPSDVHTITDDELQAEISTLLSSYSADGKQITDRAVVDGDTVNIDYVGSVDGVEFDGGSTAGAGTNVTIGVTSYIDDFLQQLIGHMPGETINVEVTFPDVYQQEDLQGKEAVFVTTINYIVETEVTDEFVKTNLSEEYGWTTVEELEAGLSEELKNTAITEHIEEYLISNSIISSIPKSLVKYQEDSMVSYYKSLSESYGVTFEEFLETYLSVDSEKTLLNDNKESNEYNAKYTLIIQAIAEELDYTVSEEDMETFFLINTGASDYSSYEESYGLPYLKQSALNKKVTDYLRDNAVMG